MNVADIRPEAVLPPASQRDRELARAAQRCIMQALDHSRAATIRVKTESGDGPSVDLPPQALKLLGQILGAMSEGRAVTIMPAKREFSTVEAANFLNVSRPFVIKEIEAGRLPHRMVGTHRRIAFEDLQDYAERMRERQQAALRRLADADQDLGLNY
jgi:excisionase family DNA binding protein